ncbi:MAG: PKD domain-containing protein [Lewinellaceae bacterium]|nr:PKD domain-containing protein [Lewinellaceae bacterium]
MDECAVGIQIIGECNFLIEDCIVANNWYYGIDAELADNVQVRRNTLYCNGTDPGGDPFLPASNAQQPPVITSVTLTQISGTATYLPPTPTFPDNIVEIFLTGDPACPNAEVQGKTFLAEAIVNPDGTWSVNGNFPATGLLTATVTNPALCSAPCGLDADFSSDSIGVNVVEFSDMSTGNPVTWLWNFGDPASGGANVANGPMPTHTFSDFGTYQVTLTITSIVNGVYCEDVEVKSVNIKCPVSAASFSYEFIGANEVAFEGMVQGTPTSWYWDFGDGGTDNVQNPVYTFVNPGLNTVILLVSYDLNGLFCQTLYFDDVNTNDPCAGLEADFTFELTDPFYCTYEFTDNSSGTPTEWNWDFGDGATSTLQSPSHSYNFDGSYTVRLIISNGDPSCIDTVSYEVNANCSSFINGDEHDAHKKPSKAALPAADAVTSDFSPIFCIEAQVEIFGRSEYMCR